MSFDKRVDLGWGILSQFLQYGASLLVLPLMVTRLSSAQVGLWYLFVAIQSLVSILDFGFTPTFSRNFSFVFAGVKILQKEGVGEGGGDINTELLASLIRSCKILYGGIAALVGLALVGPGSWYIHNLFKKNPGIPSAWAAWAIFAVATTINVYFLWYTPLLLGSGRVREDYKVGILNRGSFALIAGVGLLFSSNLAVVAGAYLMGVLISRIYAGRMARPLIAKAKPHPYEPIENLKTLGTIWHNSYKMGVVSIGAFLISRFSVFVISSFYGLVVTARYSVSLQIFSVIFSISQVALITFLPRFASYRVSGNMREFRRLFIVSTLFIWLVSMMMSGGVILFGNSMLSFIHSKTMLMDRTTLVVMAVVWLLETNHAACAAAITTGNTVPFVKAAVLSGIAICILSLVIGRLGLGVISIVLIQGMVQLTYNNWKWPHMIYKELRITMMDVITYPFRRNLRIDLA